MEWHVLFNSAKQPEYTDMENYIGGDGKRLWKSLFRHMDAVYGAKPKMTYSNCCIPGWNVKFQKSGKSFGTLYPEINRFSVFMVISYKLSREAEAVLPELSPKTRELYQNADDFMKTGLYFMMRIETDVDLEDYKKLCAIKLKPKAEKPRRANIIKGDA